MGCLFGRLQLAQIYEQMETAAAMCGDFPVTIALTAPLPLQPGSAVREACL